MDDKKLYFHCENCGVLCRKDAPYCQSCGESFSKPSDDSSVVFETDEVIADGVTYKDAKEFMQVRTDRFLTVFEKNRDKKLFFSLNLPALFIPGYWLLYRKMYKQFALYQLFEIIFCAAVFGIVYLCTFNIRNEINEYALVLYEAFGTKDLNNVDASVLLSDYNFQLFRYYELQSLMKTTYNIWYYISLVLIRIGFTSIADCLYRQQVVYGVRARKQGGVSLISALIYLVIVLVLVFIN